MSEVLQNLAFEFSSSERRKGETLFRDRAVIVSSSNETYVSATVRSSNPGRVNLSCEDVGGAIVTVKCSCAVFRKNELCRHVWAVLLTLEGRNSDFLEGKTEISIEEKTKIAMESSDDPEVCRSGSENEDALNIAFDHTRAGTAQEDSAHSKSQTKFQDRQKAYKEKQKALAKEYRKKQSAKQREFRKQRSAKHKEERIQRRQAIASGDLLNEALNNSVSSQQQKPRTPAFKYPLLVEKARQFFQSNGYEMKQPIELVELIEAKKQLSRVFHPDKGGSHEEILELNRNFQIISDYLKP